MNGTTIHLESSWLMIVDQLSMDKLTINPVGSTAATTVLTVLPAIILFKCRRGCPNLLRQPHVIFSAGLVMAFLLLACNRNVVHFCRNLPVCIDRVMNSIMNHKIIPANLTNDQKVIGIGILKWQA